MTTPLENLKRMQFVFTLPLDAVPCPHDPQASCNVPNAVCLKSDCPVKKGGDKKWLKY